MSETDTPASVAVVQADREAVQAFHKEMVRRFMLDLKHPDRPKLGEDEGDAGTLVQAFARHRLAAQQPDGEAISFEERLDYERRILAAECGSQRILNELCASLERDIRHARFTPDAIDHKAGDILESVVKRIREIDVCAAPAPVPDAALRSAQSFTLEWIGAPRLPVHPSPMTGRQSFASLEKAVAFFARQPLDATFVSLTECASRYFDRSDEARNAIAATPHAEAGEG